MNHHKNFAANKSGGVYKAIQLINHSDDITARFDRAKIPLLRSLCASLEKRFTDVHYHNNAMLIFPFFPNYLFFILIFSSYLSYDQEKNVSSYSSMNNDWKSSSYRIMQRCWKVSLKMVFLGVRRRAFGERENSNFYGTSTQKSHIVPFKGEGYISYKLFE